MGPLLDWNDETLAAEMVSVASKTRVPRITTRSIRAASARGDVATGAEPLSVSFETLASWLRQHPTLGPRRGCEGGDNECSYLINNASIVLKLQIGVTSFLFTGDANGKERDDPDANNVGHIERGLLALEQQVPGTLKVDVLKVPHHGSETASTIPFIAKTNPSYAIISASTTHHLPKETTAHRYEAPNRVILRRTDINHENNHDHILCVKEVGRTLECNYESVLEEGGPLDQ